MVKRPLTGVERQLLAEVRKRGRVRSAYRLLSEICVGYPWGWAMLRRLEARGLIRIYRDHKARGRPLVMEFVEVVE